jgi:hypothetical protein
MMTLSTVERAPRKTVEEPGENRTHNAQKQRRKGHAMDGAEGTGEAYREWLEARGRERILKEVQDERLASDNFDEWLSDQAAYATGRRQKAFSRFIDSVEGV